jgi:uncharacterized RDD family membrane protein YckC
VTKTCLQCGAVLPSSAGACNFCDSSFSVDFSSSGELQSPGALEAPRLNNAYENVSADTTAEGAASTSGPKESDAWRGELAQRLQAYRKRRRKPEPNAAQSRFSFGETSDEIPSPPTVAIAETSPPEKEDFSFTIAIGRPSKRRILEESRMVIDVSQNPEKESFAVQPAPAVKSTVSSDLNPVASMDERRLAGLIDVGCLLFAYGGFLALFGSLGGQFTLSKLSATVYASTFAIVYLQFFFLFTVFGGTTPGMMMRGLQVLSLRGEPPTSRQMLLRSAGYMLSAATFFLGFLWALWDEDELTWHDHLSKTYLSKTEAFADLENSPVAQG